VKLVSFAIHLLAPGPGRGVVEAASREGGKPVHMLPERHVSSADVEKLSRLTLDHIGDQIAMVIDGEMVMTPTIRSRIGGRLVVLTGDFSDSRCEEIARGLSHPQARTDSRLRPTGA
jgi:hypothetical protein